MLLARLLDHKYLLVCTLKTKEDYTISEVLLNRIQKFEESRLVRVAKHDQLQNVLPVHWNLLLKNESKHRQTNSSTGNVVLSKKVPFLLEYKWPGGKVINRSQSSLMAFISEANQTDPARVSKHDVRSVELVQVI